MIDFGVALLAALGIVGQLAIAALVVGIVAWFVRPASRQALAGMRQTIGAAGVWLAWTVALVAMLGSLWLSNGAHFIPCHLCWLQRYAMYPLVVVLIVVALARRWWLTLAAMAFPLVGMGISAWHVWVENHPGDATASCRKGVPCSVKWIEEYGYITIPVLAGTAFVLIALLLGIVAFWQRSQRSVEGAG